jgi:regulator of extracellular matrix RemA (YlzA/DUF370 family)
MFIHIGSGEIVSGKSIIGIFNKETLMKSEDNHFLLKNASPNDKAIILKQNGKCIYSIVSSYTIMNRTDLNITDVKWRR